MDGLRPPCVALSRQEVHVWEFTLNVDAERLAALRQLLANDERERADRFRFARDRSSWTVSRGALRLILARYTGLHPAALRFGCSPRGKPFLAGGATAQPLFFNLSHTAGRGLVAVAACPELGVDIEAVRWDLDYLTLAGVVFSPSERASLAAIAGPEQRLAFYNGWTRKEAFVKAIGEGLAFPVNRVTVSLSPGEPPGLLAIDVPGYAAGEWSLHELEVDSGFVASLAMKGHGWRVVRRVEAWSGGGL